MAGGTVGADVVRRPHAPVRNHAAQVLAMIARESIVEKSPCGLPGNPTSVAGYADDVEAGQALRNSRGPMEVQQMHVVVNEDQMRGIACGIRDGRVVHVRQAGCVGREQMQFVQRAVKRQRAAECGL